MRQADPRPFLSTVVRGGVEPPAAVVKVDDAVAAIEVGRNAGVWTVRLTETPFNALTSEADQQHIETAQCTLRDAGARFVIPSVTELIRVFDEIEAAAMVKTHR